jgi:hypothetical protein
VQAEIYIPFACMHIASMVYFLPIDNVRLRFFVDLACPPN